MIKEKVLLSNFEEITNIEGDIIHVSDWAPALSFDFYILNKSINSNLFFTLSQNQRDDAFAVKLLEYCSTLSLDGNIKGMLKLPLVLSEEFTHILILPSSYFNFFSGRLDKERAMMLLAVPINGSEFSGNESASDFKDMQKQMKELYNWKREPSPKVLLRFDNPDTGGGTYGSKDVLVNYSLLVRELEQLSGISSGFMEITNIHGVRGELLSPSKNVYLFPDDQTKLNLEEAKDSIFKFLTD